MHYEQFFKCYFYCILLLKFVITALMFLSLYVDTVSNVSFV